MASGALAGCKIVVTRSLHQASDLKKLLEAEGATVYTVPAIEIGERKDGILQLQQALQKITDYSWLLLTSVNTVKILDRVLREMGKDWAHFGGIKIACIGTATAQRVTESGGIVSLLPPLFQAESLAGELLKNNLSGHRILLPRAAGSRLVLPGELQKGGAIVEEIHIYAAELPQQSKNDLSRILKMEKIDFLTFTSSSTVRNFAELAGDLPWQSIPVACIGPITAQTLREYGVQPAVEADEFTIPGLVASLKLHREQARTKEKSPKA